MDWEKTLNYSQGKRAEICVFNLFWELTGEMKNLKNAAINLKDDIMKMKPAKDRENYSNEI